MQFSVVVALMLFCGCVFGQSPDTQPLRLAVLVGIETYPELAKHEQLQGCVNDTEIIGAMLTQRFGFEQANVVTLTNEAATGEAIRNQFARLIGAVKSMPADAEPAQIFFHFSGHGSQVPDQAVGDADCDELDGLDETLVPYDATRQGGSEDIRDDEIFSFVDQLCANSRAKVWLLLDCCHSGTAARGSTRFRSLERGNAIPLDVQPDGNHSIVSKRLPAGAVLLSACRASEKEPEYQDGLKHYGLLSRFVSETLNSEQSVSRLSYDDLCASLLIRYHRAGVSQPPTPQLEGKGDSIVLGANDKNDRPAYWNFNALPNDRSLVTLHAGSLHGVTAGSLYEVFDSPEQIVKHLNAGATSIETATPRLWLKVKTAEGITSLATVFRWLDNEMVSAALPPMMDQGFVIERRHEHGSSTLRVRVVPAIDRQQDGPAFEPGDPLTPPSIGEMLSRGRRNESESQWLQWVKAEEACDVLIRVSGGMAAVFPATGNSSAEIFSTETRDDLQQPLRGGWGPINLASATAGDELLKILVQVNRVRSLLRIAALSPQIAAIRGPGTQPQVKLELVEVDVDAQYKITTDRAWPATLDDDGTPSLQMRDGAIYAIRVTNLEPVETGRTVYVTVLHIDANMGIDVLLPYQEGATDEQVIHAGDSRCSGAFRCNDPGDEPVHGLRTAIAFATREPNALHLLASPTLSVTRGAVTQDNHSLNEMLINQTYFQPPTPVLTRGGNTKLDRGPDADPDWASTNVQWSVRP